MLQKLCVMIAIAIMTSISPLPAEIMNINFLSKVAAVNMF